MKNNIMYRLLILVFLIVSISSCSVMPPEEIAKNFFEKISKDDIAGAKELCLPSAKEEIDHLEKMDAFKKNINKGIFEQMEVVVSPEPLDGDTAIVNYKVDDYKNKLTLILKDNKWKVAMSEQLKQIIILEYESSDLIKTMCKNERVFFEDYKGMYFDIKNVAVCKKRKWNSENVFFRAYDPEENMLYGLKRYFGSVLDSYDYKLQGGKVNVLKGNEDFLYFYNEKYKNDKYYDCNPFVFYFFDLDERNKAELINLKETRIKEEYRDWKIYGYYSMDIQMVCNLRGSLYKIDKDFPKSIQFEFSTVLSKMK